MRLIKISTLLISVSLLVTSCSVSAIDTTGTAATIETTSTIGITGITGTTGTTQDIIEPITSIRAEDDYYGYINLGTLQNITLEYGQTHAGSFESIDIEQQLIDSTLRIVNSEEEFPEGSCEQVIRDAYLQYLDFVNDDAAQAQACQEIEEELKRINDAQTLDELITLAEELRVEYGCQSFSGLVVDMDYLNPDKHGISINQAAAVCGVPLEKVDENAYLAEEYEKRIIDTLQVMGKSYEQSKETAHNLMLLIIDIAWATDFEIANSSNPYAYMSFMSNSEIDEALSNVGRADYEQMAGIHDNPYGGWLVMDKGQLTAVDAVWKEENLEELKAWAAYSLLDQYGGFITSKYSIYEEYFPTSHETIDLQALTYIDNVFPSVLSDFYVREYYTEDMDQQFTRMCEDIRASYRDLITNSDWLSEDARQRILQKLDNIQFITGGFCLEQMKNDPSLPALFGNNILETQRNAAKRYVQESVEDIGKPRNRLELGMPMHMVNACYSLDNTVTVSVAIMSAPFFDANADYFTNLGGLGAVVAHEVGHAFDSNMIQYNADGVYDPSWLSSQDAAALEGRNQAAVEYFEKYFSVFDVYRVDGELTLGENYADLGGMECITNIAQTNDDYVSLFENYARIWCQLSLNSDVIEQLSEDPHSPATIRVNAILATTDAFYEVYGVEENDGMYIRPENRISRWK